MRHALAEVLRRAPFGVHVMREEVAGLAGMGDDVRLRDRASQGLAALADPIVLEKPLLDDHDFPPVALAFASYTHDTFANE